MKSIPTRYPRLDYDSVLSSLLPSRDVSHSLWRQKNRTLVVLDDDPTGTQTVHDITVITTFDKKTLKAQLATNEKGFFILTNSRAYHDAEASSLLDELLVNLREASAETRNPIDIVLRSDSCLRGHFPLEPQIAEEVLGPFAAWILAPAFFEGGRVTLNDIHYVREGIQLIPVGDTPFAADKDFGFRSSNLREWIEEKFGSRQTPRIESIGIDELREERAADKIATRLDSIASGQGPPLIVILNAFSPADMNTFAEAVSLAAPSTRLLYRTGASFVSAHLGIEATPSLSPQDLFKSSGDVEARGGLIVVGSYVPKTTEQREILLARCEGFVTHFELNVEQLLESKDSNVGVIEATVRKVETALRSGNDVVLSTSRKLITKDSGKSSLHMGSIISGVMVAIVKLISVRPKYVVAKGGITSSDIATKALGIRRALVVGQAAVGVPLWLSQDGGADKWTGVPYIVFPGNVGKAETLADLVTLYRRDE